MVSTCLTVDGLHTDHTQLSTLPGKYDPPTGYSSKLISQEMVSYEVDNLGHGDVSDQHHLRVPL